MFSLPKPKESELEDQLSEHRLSVLVKCGKLNANSITLCQEKMIT